MIMVERRGPDQLSFRSERSQEAASDTVVFTLESTTFPLSSSASSSVNRCSFASDARDGNSHAPGLCMRLGARRSDLHQVSSSTDPDANKTATVTEQSRRSTKGDKATVKREESDANREDEDQLSDSVRNSFSAAIRECQERISRSEAIAKRVDRQRPASLDLNNTMSSPRLETMRKSLLSSHKSGVFPSPITQKGWSLERVPPHVNDARRQTRASFLPMNNGRALPSKWEDAERWIFSPFSGDFAVRTSAAAAAAAATQRRPKAKSGPLGPPGSAHNSLYSPAIPMIRQKNTGGLEAGTPSSSGAIARHGQALPFGGNPQNVRQRTEPCIARSVSIHSCSEAQPSTQLLSFQDEDPDGTKATSRDISRDSSRRGMATQISPQGSTRSSPSIGTSFNALLSSAVPTTKLHSVRSCKAEIRDVQVDERITANGWSKKHRSLSRHKSSEAADDWRREAEAAHASAWDMPDIAKSVSKVKREEARITAWENLQKAKAEAAVRNLEMKLEKKRTSSMNKIMKRLMSAQKRAQEMRKSASHNHQLSRAPHKILSFYRTRQMGSLSGCFTCHAF